LLPLFPQELKNKIQAPFPHTKNEHKMDWSSRTDEKINLHSLTHKMNTKWIEDQEQR
jgi:hypothetical protein